MSICLFLIYLLITCAAAFSVRYHQSVTDSEKIGTALLKAAASFPSVLYAFTGYQRHRTKSAFFILAAIICGLIADAAINISFPTGGIIFAAGHLLYDFAFIAKRRPSGKQWLSVIIAVVLTLIPLYFFRHLMLSALAVIGVIAYAAILFSTVIYSKPSGRLIFACASIFALSDPMLIFNIINQSGFFLNLVSLIVYYISLLLYGYALWRSVF